MYNLLREALAARRKASPDITDIVTVSATIPRKLFEKVRELTGERGCSVDAYLRRLIRSDLHRLSQIAVQAEAA